MAMCQGDPPPFEATHATMSTAGQNIHGREVNNNKVLQKARFTIVCHSDKHCGNTLHHKLCGNTIHHKLCGNDINKGLYSV